MKSKSKSKTRCSHQPHIPPPSQEADDAFHFQAHEGDVHGAGHEAGAGDAVADVALFVVDGVGEGSGASPRCRAVSLTKGHVVRC